MLKNGKFENRTPVKILVDRDHYLKPPRSLIAMGKEDLYCRIVETATDWYQIYTH